MFPLILAPFLLVSHVAFAQQPVSPEPYDEYEQVIEDPEPNWETVEYSCPLSIKTRTGEHKFRGYRAFDYSTKYGTWARLKEEPAVNIHHRFDSKRWEPYIFCNYENTDTEIIIHAKDAIACGAGGKPWRAVCWTTDPYAGKK